MRNHPSCLGGLELPHHGAGMEIRGRTCGKVETRSDRCSVAAAQADVFQKNSDNKLNKIDKNMKIKR